MIVQLLVMILGISIIFVLWMNAENEKRIKAKELQLYEAYNKTFEEAITAIRLRQHEFDNAVEALIERENTEKKLIIKILQEDTQKMSIEIANISRKYLNSEIEKFCVRGYSTKGEKRGVGLSRVKDIIKIYKADFYIENVSYNDENYLSFKIRLL